MSASQSAVRSRAEAVQVSRTFVRGDPQIQSSETAEDLRFRAT